MKAVATIVTVVATLAYPVAVWWGLTHLEARSVGLLVLALLVPLLAVRFRGAPRGELVRLLRVPLVVLAVIVTGVVLGDARFVMSVPVVVNVVLLVEFGVSLRRGAVPFVERFARLQEGRWRPDVAEDALLSDGQKAHCRATTVVWCVFFALNASTTAALALLAAPGVWATYTGGVAYALMGVLFAGEVAVRWARFGREAVLGPGRHPAGADRGSSRPS